MIVEQETTGEREPDGQGGWQDRVIMRPLACTEDPECVGIINECLRKLREHQEKFDKNQERTIIRTNSIVMKHTVEEVVSEEKNWLDEILEQTSK